MVRFEEVSTIVEPPEVTPRHERLFAYLRFNARRITVDVLVLGAWLLINFSVFDWFGLPTWLMYVTIFAGVIVYSRITIPWERPYRSPDLPETDPSDELKERNGNSNEPEDDARSNVSGDGSGSPGSMRSTGSNQPDRDG